MASPIYAVAPSSTGAPLRSPSVPTQAQYNEVHQLAAETAIDPLIAEIGKDKSTELTVGIGQNEPLLDQDPFFLRQQNWSHQGGNRASDILVKKTETGLEIRPSHSVATLRLNVALEPVFQSDQYLFFSAREKSNILLKNGQSFGEGLFIIEVDDLQAASVNSSKVPVYFFPLPGNGWVSTETVAVNGSEIPHQDLLVFNSLEGDSLPVRHEDIATVLKIEKLNQTLAFALRRNSILDRVISSPKQFSNAKSDFYKNFSASVLNAQKSGGPEQGLRAVEQITKVMRETLHIDDEVLAPGSTAAFGLMFTGRDFSSNGKSDWFKSVRTKNIFTEKIAGLFSLLIPQAHAQIELHPEVVNFLWRTARVMTVVGGIYTSGIVAQYTILRSKIKTRDAALGPRAGIRTSFDVLAHSLTTLYQIPYVWPANIIEYYMDRVNASNNSMIRRMYNWTYGYTRTSNNRTPVNNRTMLLGVLGLGFMDTALVAFQAYILVPEIGKVLYTYFPDFIAQRAYNAWLVPNPEVALFNMLSVMYNLTAYITVGAYSFAHDVQDITTNEKLSEVSQQMKKEGKSPDGQDKEEFKERVDAIVRATLLSKGLPGSTDFLFDAGTLYRNLQGFVGYSVPSEGSEKQTEPDNYLALQRQGLNGRAIDKAIASLDRGPRDAAHTEALAMLQGLRSDFRLLSNARDSFWNLINSTADRLRDARNNPSVPNLRTLPADLFSESVFNVIEIGRKFRDARKKITLLSYLKVDSGDISALLPADWVSKGSDAATVAGRAFRTELETLSGARDNSVSQHAELDPYLKESRFAKWQMRRALRRATKTLSGSQGRDMTEELPTLSSESPILKEWKLLVEQEMIRINGIYPDVQSPEINAKVQEHTLAEVARIKASDGFPAYLPTLNARDAARVEATLTADVYTEYYVELIQTKEAMPPTSPAQPGLFQRVRQTSVVRNSRVLTAAVRSLEAPFSDSRYQRGLQALVKRATPFGDLWDGNVRTTRQTPVKAVFEYLFIGTVFNSMLPYAQFWTNHIFRGTTIMGPWATTNRLMTKLGFKPGSKFGSMMFYAFVGSFATFTGMIPYGLFVHDIKPFFEAIGGGFGVGWDAAAYGVSKTIEFCSGVLTRGK